MHPPVPYHVVPGPAASQRIILISYHAPPSAEVGAQRWAGMARYFAEAGWGLDVIGLDPAGLRNRSPEQLDLLPQGTRLYGVADPLPPLDQALQSVLSARRRMKGWMRVEHASWRPPLLRQEDVTPGAGSSDSIVTSYFAWREHARSRRWARRAVDLGHRVHQPGVHQWVVTSGPPHMAHEAGRLLARSLGLPLATDFRDPWRFSEWFHGPAWQRRAQRAEPRVIAESTLVVVNVERVRAIMQEAYPGARIVTVTNGVDEGAVPESPQAPGRFVIGSAGTIYLARDPAPLFEAVADLVTRRALGPDQLGLEFKGFFDETVLGRLRSLAASHGLEQHLGIHPGGTRADAARFMASCAVLVALQQGSDAAVPAKVFDYMRYPAKLLVVANPDSAVGDLLAGTSASVCAGTDTAGIRSALEEAFERHRAGRSYPPLAAEARFTRRYQAEHLIRAMVLSRAPQTPIQL